MVIPAAASLLRARQNTVFVICGDGVMKPDLQAAVAGLPNVRLLPLQPSERLTELLGMADIHLLPQSPDAGRFGPSVQLSGCLASGRP